MEVLGSFHCSSNVPVDFLCAGQSERFSQPDGCALGRGEEQRYCGVGSGQCSSQWTQDQCCKYFYNVYFYYGKSLNGDGRSEAKTKRLYESETCSI